MNGKDNKAFEDHEAMQKAFAELREEGAVRTTVMHTLEVSTDELWMLQNALIFYRDVRPSDIVDDLLILVLKAKMARQQKFIEGGK